MKGYGRTITQTVISPWMQVLAVLIGLTILFLLCTTRIQAGLTPVGVNPTDSLSKHTDCFPKGVNPLHKVKSWYLDYSDISNEAGYESSPAASGTEKHGVVIKKISVKSKFKETKK